MSQRRFFKKVTKINLNDFERLLSVYWIIYNSLTFKFMTELEKEYVLIRQKRDEVPEGTLSCPDRNLAVFHHYRHYEGLRLLPSVCDSKLIQQTLIIIQKVRPFILLKMVLVSVLFLMLQANVLQQELWILCKQKTAIHFNIFTICWKYSTLNLIRQVWLYLTYISRIMAKPSFFAHHIQNNSNMLSRYLQ